MPETLRHPLFYLEQEQRWLDFLKRYVASKIKYSYKPKSQTHFIHRLNVHHYVNIQARLSDMWFNALLLEIRSLILVDDKKMHQHGPTNLDLGMGLQTSVLSGYTIVLILMPSLFFFFFF